MASESLGIFTAGIGVAAAASARPEEPSRARAKVSYAPDVTVGRSNPAARTPGRASIPGPGVAGLTVSTAQVASGAVSSPPVWVPTANRITIASPSASASSKADGGSIGSSHGGSGATVDFGNTASTNTSAGSGQSDPGDVPPLFILPAGSGTASGMTSRSVAGGSEAPASDATPQRPMAGPDLTSIGDDGSTGSTDSLSGAKGGPETNVVSTPFPLWTLDVNAGQVIYPGANHLATLGGNVELSAQVKGATVTSISWNTAGLTKATGITGANTADLKFQWATTNTAATTNSATLTVTTSNNQTATQTYTFQVPAGSGTAGTGTRAVPLLVNPDLVSSAAPAFNVLFGSVDANSGSYDNSIVLPTYNPNVAPVVLAYDSTTASPAPILALNHTIDASQAVPSRVSYSMTFNGVVGSTYWTDTTQLIPGDIQRIPVQANASTLASGRYNYSITTNDVRATTTTTTASGVTTVINNASSAFGSGWTLAGLERVIPASGGVVLDLGAKGQSLWFATGSGSTYITPAGEFSTLVANSNGTYTRTFTSGDKIQFDAAGRQTATVDTNGVTTTYLYDGSGRLSSIQDNYGASTTFAYDGSGLLGTITDPSGRQFTFTHNGTRLSGATMPDTAVWAYAYDTAGHMTQITDPRNKITTLTYGPGGRVYSYQNPDSTSQTFLKSQSVGVITVSTTTAANPALPTLLAEVNSAMTDQLGYVTSLAPDWGGLGLTTVATNPMGQISSSVRDSNGLATIMVDPMNRIGQASYDGLGNLTGTIGADGSTTSATYNSLARPLTTTDQLGRVTTMTYDAQGNMLTLKTPGQYTTNLTYTPTGQLDTTTNPPVTTGGLQTSTEMVTSNAYGTGDLQTSSTVGGQTTLYEYTTAGLVKKATAPGNKVTTYTYDAMNRLKSVTDPLLHTTSYTYGIGGKLITVTDPRNLNTRMTYDSMFRFTSVTDPRNAVTTTNYDLAGRVTSIQDSVNNTTSYTLDAAGRVLVTTDPFNRTTTLTRNAAGEVTSLLDRNNRLKQYVYDARGRVTAENWVNGSNVTVYSIASTYDAASQLLELQDPSSHLTYTYDADGNQTSVSTAGTPGVPAVTLTSTYSSQHLRTGLSDSLSTQGAITYSYDDKNRLNKVASTYGGAAGPQVTFGYDSNNNLTTESRSIGGTGTAVASTFGYDTANRLTTIQHGVQGGSTLASYTYNYDAADRLTTETNAEGTVNYTYDDSDQLTGASGSRSESYSYDANGNRTMAGYTTGTNNQMTAGAGYTYTYGPNGNLASKTQTSTGYVWNYTWDYRNRMIGVVETNSSGTVLMQGTYTYNALNQRILYTETVGGQTTTKATIYDGVNPYADFDGSGALQVRYLVGGGYNSYIARVAASGTVAWYLGDHQGSIRDLANTSGAVINHIAYDSYGKIMSESSPANGDRFKSAGMAWDAALGDYYVNARYYDPIAGSFLSQDPTEFSAGDANLYRYVNASPTNSIDPTGLDALDTASNFFAGWGDTLSFGITGGIRAGTDWALGTNWNGGIDPVSGAYLTGVGTGVVHIALITKGKNCFPAGTPVSTEQGSRAIETIKAGELVWACDLKSNEWHLRPVITPLQHYREGDIVKIRVEDETLEATGDHPFWVIEGDGLFTRPDPEHVPSTEIGSTIPGRWVDARDLRPQDRLLRKSKRPVAVESLTIEIRQIVVYNMEVADLHTYAVGVQEVLVHNRPAVKPTTIPISKISFPAQQPYALPEKLLQHGPFDWAKYEPIWVEADRGRYLLTNGATRVENALRAGITELPALILRR